MDHIPKCEMQNNTTFRRKSSDIGFFGNDVLDTTPKV